MKNPVAELNKPDSLLIVKAASTENEYNDIAYYCPDPRCLDPQRVLLLKRSNLGNQYFSHRPGYDHDIHPKTLFHKMVVAEFRNMNRYVLPEGIRGKKKIEIDWSRSTVGFNGLDGDQPDIKLVDKNGFECFIEPTINYPVNDKKLNTAVRLDIPLIELNLYRLFMESEEKNRDHFDFLVFHASEMANDPSNARYLFIPERYKSPKRALSTLAIAGGAALAAAAMAYFIFRNK